MQNMKKLLKIFRDIKKPNVFELSVIEELETYAHRLNDMSKREAIKFLTEIKAITAILDFSISKKEKVNSLLENTAKNL